MDMELSNDLLRRLRDAKTGYTVEVWDGLKVVVVKVNASELAPCRGCVFQELKEGCKQCPMRWACMSRWRGDRRSVAFKMKNEE